MSTMSWLDGQDSERAQTALAAGDTLWGRVQRLRVVQFVSVIAVPIVLAILAARNSSNHTVVAVAAYGGFVLTMLDTLVLNWAIVSARREAAQAQDRFDAIALSLERPSPRVDQDSDEARLIDLARRQNAARRRRNRGWYTPALSDLPLGPGRIACMRESATWDGTVRSRWAAALTALAVLAAVGIAVWAVVTGEAVGDLFVDVLAPLTPAFVWLLREIREQRDSADRIGDIHQRLRTAWGLAVRRDRNNEWLTAAALEFSRDLLEYRAATSPVPHLVYMRLRPQQTLTAEAVAQTAIMQWASASNV